jgi:hypothetical protein
MIATPEKRASPQELSHRLSPKVSGKGAITPSQDLKNLGITRKPEKSTAVFVLEWEHSHVVLNETAVTSAILKEHDWELYDGSWKYMMNSVHNFFEKRGLSLASAFASPKLVSLSLSGKLLFRGNIDALLRSTATGGSVAASGSAAANYLHVLEVKRADGVEQGTMDNDVLLKGILQGALYSLGLAAYVDAQKIEAQVSSRIFVLTVTSEYVRVHEVDLDPAWLTTLCDKIATRSKLSIENAGILKATISLLRPTEPIVAFAVDEYLPKPPRLAEKIKELELELAFLRVAGV